MGSHTLLLRCAGPMQSWGTRSRFTQRDTELEPSKSGIIGILAAALGRERGTPLADLAALRMAVRADREGTLMRDYQTSQGVLRAGGDDRAETVLSERYYLADAAFLVGLEGADAEFLGRLQAALCRPRWPLYLGRRGCPPGRPIHLADGLRRGESLMDALKTYPPVALPRKRNAGPGSLRFVVECLPGEEGELRLDAAVDFRPDRREYEGRRVRTEMRDRAANPEEDGACS